MSTDYEDIVNLPHHVSTQHPRMSMEGRAGQFAPFAALTGLGAAFAVPPSTLRSKSTSTMK